MVEAEAVEAPEAAVITEEDRVVAVVPVQAVGLLPVVDREANQVLVLALVADQVDREVDRVVAVQHLPVVADLLRAVVQAQRLNVINFQMEPVRLQIVIQAEIASLVQKR